MDARGRAIALAVALGALALASPAGAHRTDAAAPYIEKPGVVRDFSGGTVARFAATIWCGKFKGIAVFHVGKGGRGVFDKTTFICDNATHTTVHFSLNVSELARFGHGSYQYWLRVGRHNDKGQVTRYTDSFTHLFTYS